MNKFNRALIVGWILFQSNSPTFAVEKLIDKVVAVADGRPILYSVVQQKIARGPLVALSDYPADEASPKYERALQDAINTQLILARAKDLDIDVTDEEADQEISRSLEERGQSKSGLLAHLKETGATFEDYRRDYREIMVQRKWQGRVIFPLIKITDKDVENFYLKKAGGTGDLIELELRQIMIEVPQGATGDIAEAKQRLALEIHQRLADGLSFDQAIKVYSDEPNAKTAGGAVQTVVAKELSPVIRAAVETLEIGQFARPVQIANSWRIFYLQNKKFSGGREFAGQKAKLFSELQQIEIMAQTRRWLAEERQKVKIVVVGETKNAP